MESTEAQNTTSSSTRGVGVFCGGLCGGELFILWEQLLSQSGQGYIEILSPIEQVQYYVI